MLTLTRADILFSASFGVKRVIWYALHNIPSYQNLICTRQVGKILIIESWRQIRKKFESVFLLGSSFTLLIFLSICKSQLNENVLFFNTAITIFYLICSLNIPHSNQNPSLVPVERSVSIYSKFILWQHFNISFMMTIVTQKYFLYFFSCNFTIVTGNGNANYIVCLSFPVSQLKLNWESQVY